ncbi:MAG: thiamine pyrophosphate-dependent enzyme [Pseudomonadota bacterium]
MSPTAKDFDNDFPITWCPGCGNFAILASLKKALAELGYSPHEVAVVSGIGQAGKTPHYMRCNFFNGLHGRALPVAEGARMVNPGLPVLAVGGDGDMYGEGGNHFIHAIRRNVNVTLLAHNNKVFGLTQGQASPTTDAGVVTKIQPHGVFAAPFNPLALAVVGEASFTARAYAGNAVHLTDMIKQAISAEGFSVLDILQPCLSFDKLHTFKWYNDRVYDLNQTGHDVRDLAAAVEKAREWGDRIPIGVFYVNPDRPSYEQASGVLRAGPLVGRKTDPALLQREIDAFM